MRAALYMRVSSRDKQERANQTRQLREFCIAQGWTITSEYEDHDSDNRADRAQFRKMMADVPAAFRCCALLGLGSSHRDEVLELLAQGLSLRKIARKTGVSVATVRRARQGPTAVT